LWSFIILGIQFTPPNFCYNVRADVRLKTDSGASGVVEKLPMGGILATKMPNLPLACIAETNYGKRKHKNKNLQMP